LTRPQLRTVIDTKNDDSFIIAGFDPMHDDVGQAWP